MYFGPTQALTSSVPNTLATTAFGDFYHRVWELGASGPTPLVKSWKGRVAPCLALRPYPNMGYLGFLYWERHLLDDDDDDHEPKGPKYLTKGYLGILY